VKTIEKRDSESIMEGRGGPNLETVTVTLAPDEEEEEERESENFIRLLHNEGPRASPAYGR
jgi:hypothetical protein